MKIHWHSYYNYNAYLFNCIRNVILETQICGIHSSTNESWVVFHAGYHYSQLMAMITWAKKKFKKITIIGLSVHIVTTYMGDYKKIEIAVGILCPNWRIF